MLKKLNFYGFLLIKNRKLTFIFLSFKHLFVEQFGQAVLNTPLPSPQQLSGLPLLLVQTPQMYKLFQEFQTPTAQEQPSTTIGSLLNSAGTSASSQILWFNCLFILFYQVIVKLNSEPLCLFFHSPLLLKALA